jgi:hypothetical protein
MKRFSLFHLASLLLICSLFAFYAFRNQDGAGDQGYAFVVVSPNDISISYGNGRHENIGLKAGRYVDNDNTTVGVFNKMGMQGYVLKSSLASKDGSLYFIFSK